MPPIYQTSTYAQRAPGEHQGYEYSRTDNPTRTALQANLASLESAKHALVFGSGLAAIDAVLNTLESGDRVLACDDLYGGTYRLFSQVAVHRGIEFEFVPFEKQGAIEHALEKPTKLVWIESPTNPLLKLIDIRKTVDVAHAAGAKVGVDNTFLSPYNQRPLELGADLVMHSMTKYLNGHSDVVMGALATNDSEWYGRLKYLQNAIGAVPGPMDCFLALRGIKTLAVRMDRHNANAQRIAEWLADHPQVNQVVYPGLSSHPHHALAQSQQTGYGGMITFFIEGGLEAARKFLESVEIFALAESLGGVESLIEHPAIMTHASIPAEVRAEIGLTDDLIRISVGIESADDLIADLEQAFAAAKA